MDGYSKYKNSVVRASVESTRVVRERYSKECDQLFRNEILDLDGPRALNRHLSHKEEVISKLFYGFIEVHKSYEVLKEHEIYVGRFPYSGTEISKVSYLYYNVENYLNEFYLLKERIKRYLTTIGRLYRNDPRHAALLKHTRVMFKVIPTVFDDLIKARGSHVHQTRYSDQDFKRLSTIELLINFGGDEVKELEIIYKIDYKKLRRKWKNTIKSKNKTLLEALNLIFENLYPHIFTKKGNIRYPRARKSA